MDSETEAIMQDIIDTTFKNCTVLAVMHCLTHIARYDKIALLENGCLLEFEAPATLLSRESKFAELYQMSAIQPTVKKRDFTCSEKSVIKIIS